MEKMFLNKNFEFGGTVEDLKKDKGNYNGVLIFVLPDDFGHVKFEEKNGVEEWRGHKVSIPVKKLQDLWIKNAQVLYVGSSASKTVYDRACEFISFWRGLKKNVSAYAGRALGQIHDFKKLEVWYLEGDNPQWVKNELINAFKEEFGSLPFANLKF